MPEKSAKTERLPFVRLDFEGESRLYTQPSRIIETREPDEVRAALEQLRGRNAAGFLSYEAGHALEPSLARLAKPAGPGDPPLLWFGMFERVETAPPLSGTEGAWIGEPIPKISFDDYVAAAEEIREDIREGDVYQVNFTFPCGVPVAGSPSAMYAQLRSRADAGWSALIFTGTHWLISCSPELFFTARGGQVTCRPMKGTAPPASDPEVLRTDPKNRAENLMIVDLVRNDLSRVVRPGSVKVPELFSIEHYPTVLQMTSSVVGELEDSLDAIDVLEAMFPCGSITGAPKIRAMERIDALEGVRGDRRGVYTGSIGHVRANGDAEFNVAIRTLVLADGEKCARYHVGSGIVIDSEAEAEWNECLQKAAFVASRNDFELLETFAFGPYENPSVRLHLDRLQRSASDLAFTFDRNVLESELDRMKSGLERAVRMRIALERSGRVQFQISDLSSPMDTPVTVAVARRRNAADDFRLAYKTSDRLFYDDARRASGLFEIVFTDHEGFLTEGSFTNLFVPRGDLLLTPPQRRGLLPGILRQQLIENGRAIEQDLRPRDLEGGFFLGNSLRGLIEAEVVPARAELCCND